MLLLPPRPTLTDTLFPYTTLFRSVATRSMSSITADRVRSETARIVPHSVAVSGMTLVVVPARILETATLWRSEEHTSELQSLMRNSYDVFCLKKKKK